MSFIEEIEAELGPLSEAELRMVDREVGLLAKFAHSLVGRLQPEATAAQRQEAITELLYEDPEMFATFSELIDVAKTNRGSPLQSLHRLKRAVEDEAEPETRP
jgi:GTP cyclohydrolase FolE2